MRADITYDVIIIGAGIIGVSTAYNLSLSQPEFRVLLLEKEAEPALHQTGHNSGVIHSGIYYKPGSLKAQSCVNGYKQLLEFAQSHDIKHEICGKIIVATNEREIKALDTIYQRGVQNGLEGLSILSSEEIKAREPHCAGIKGIWVPQTGIIDYVGMTCKMLELFKENGGEMVFNSEVMSFEKGKTIAVNTSGATYHARKIISCAGLFSDKVSEMSAGPGDLRILPFRGEYYKLKEDKRYLVKNLIYPVPDPSFPFLGVHFTRMFNGEVEAGPNAVLALKREGYIFSDFKMRDTADILNWPGFWKIAAKYGKTGVGEVYRSLSKAAFTKALQKLIPEITSEDLVKGGAGVRAQACDREGNLIDDFNIINEDQFIHVRNAPSPAATASLEIGRSIANLIKP